MKIGLLDTVLSIIAQVIVQACLIAMLIHALAFWASAAERTVRLEIQDYDPIDIPVPPPLVMPVPEDNLPDEAKAHIGLQELFDSRFSINNTSACMDCHLQEHGFSDPKQVSEGIVLSNGQRAKGTRHALKILNSAYQKNKFWDDVSPDGLPDQFLRPLQNGNEMGRQRPRDIVNRIKQIPGYVKEFHDAGLELNETSMAACAAQAQYKIVATDTNYARFLKGDTTAMALDEKIGMHVFFGEGKCARCHSGWLLSDNGSHNIGTEYVARRGNLNNADQGRSAALQSLGQQATNADVRSFKTPTLVACADSAPYMHNGFLPTLRDVIEYKCSGGVLVSRNGNRTVDARMDKNFEQLALTEEQKDALETFLVVSLEPHDYPKIETPELP